MTVELSRATFKRLVWLYAVTIAVSVLAFVPQLLDDRWFAFGEAFDTLVAERFGGRDWPDSAWIAVGVVLLTGIGWTVASVVGLLHFRRWAHFGIWASLLLLLTLSGAIFGFEPVYGSVWDDIMGALSGTVLGAIVLLAYAKDFGDDWFAQSSVRNGN